tara:strand:- start:29 stop:544 length:516 start_codon:yes stop_codon:yes gene_type:complete
MQHQIEFYTPREISSLLKVCPATVRNMIKRGDMKALQLKGGRGVYRIPSTELQRMLGAPLTFEQPSKSESVFAPHNFHRILRERCIDEIPTSPVRVTKESKLRGVFFGSDDSNRSKKLNNRIHALLFKYDMHDMTVSEFTQTYGAMDLGKFRGFGANSIEAVYNAIYRLDD